MDASDNGFYGGRAPGAKEKDDTLMLALVLQEGLLLRFCLQMHILACIHCFNLLVHIVHVDATDVDLHGNNTDL
jgi:hypothetical protein